MTDIVTLVLPRDLPDDVVAELQNELTQIKEVDETGVEVVRAIDVAALLVWVAFAGDALAVVGSAVDLFKRISGHAEKKGIKGIMIELPNGARISMDSASPDEIKKIVSDWKEEE